MNGLVMILINILLNGLCEGSPLSFVKAVWPVSSDVRIVGGEDVKPHIYPFVVAILLTKNNHTAFCGGTLITPQFVLTAAHCFDTKPQRVMVLLGAHNISKGVGEVMMSETSIIHEGWNESQVINDIALVQLKQDVVLNGHVTTVGLATSNSTYVGQTGTILGWGREEHNKQSKVLKSVDSLIITNEECAKSYRIQRTHLCTSGASTKGSCQGDSGGPILVDGLQVGLVSFGARNCTAGYPSVFTRVSDYHQWIEAVINGAVLARGASRIINVLVASVALLIQIKFI